MKFKLERITPKSLDQDVEKNGAKEIRNDYKDSYDHLFDDDRDFYEDFKNYTYETGDVITESQVGLDDTFSEPLESDAIRKGVAESEEEEEEAMALWNKEDLGIYTINTPTIDKQSVEEQDRFMQPVSKSKLQDLDPEDEEVAKELKEIVQSLEGIF